MKLGSASTVKREKKDFIGATRRASMLDWVVAKCKSALLAY